MAGWTLFVRPTCTARVGVRQIGAELGVPWTAVSHQLRRAGVTMRRGGPPARPASTQQILELRDQGLTWNEVAEQVGMTRSGAWSRYQKAQPRKGASRVPQLWPRRYPSRLRRNRPRRSAGSVSLPLSRLSLKLPLGRPEPSRCRCTRPVLGLGIGSFQGRARPPERRPSGL